MQSGLVLVVGATGGVGQLVTAKLLERNIPVRVLTRNLDKAEQMFAGKAECVVGDIRDRNSLVSVIEGVRSIICCAGTTAFPSERWEFESSLSPLDWLGAIFDRDRLIEKAKNSPMKADGEGVKNLVAVAPRDLERFVFISSVGVLRKGEFPFSILNSFGVLDAKLVGEQAIMNSGLAYTIIRPGRLIDGPFTSYDLNTLLRATTDGKLGVVVGTGDKLAGDTSRIDLATACVECLGNERVKNQVFELVNKGTRPANINWSSLFESIPAQ